MGWIAKQIRYFAETMKIATTRDSDIKLFKEIEDSHIKYPYELPTHVSYNNCGKDKRNGCGLAYCMKSEYKTYCKEFVFEKVNTAGGEDVRRTVNVVSANCKNIPQAFACPKCFYNEAVKAVIKRVPHISIDLVMRIKGQDVSKINLLGVLSSTNSAMPSPENKYILGIVMQTEKKENYLVAHEAGEELYLRIKERSPMAGALPSAGGYIIDRSFAHNNLHEDFDFRAYPIDSIFYVTEDGDKENLYLFNKLQVDTGFEIHEKILKNNFTIQNDIKESKPLQNPPKSVKNDKKPESFELPFSGFFSRFKNFGFGRNFVKILALAALLGFAFIFIKRTKNNKVHNKIKVL